MHGPLPIVVGVTGHRDLRSEDLASLTDAVTRVLTALRARYPHTDLVVLSSLAEGADRLAARVALDLGLRLVAAIPLDDEDYKKDFSSAASLAEYDALVVRAERSFVVPDPSGRPRKRPECYARLGAYVARHCHLLLALWDGRATNRTGGTAETVRARREGAPPEFAPHRPLDPPQTGIVYQIVTPRLSNALTEGTPFELRVLPPAHCPSAAEAETAFKRVCRSTDAFNAIGANSSARIVAERETSRQYLLPSYGPASLPPGLEAIRTLYACADQAAIRFQQRTRWTVRSLFSLAFAIVVAFELFAEGDDPLAAVSVPVKPLDLLDPACHGLSHCSSGANRTRSTRNTSSIGRACGRPACSSIGALRRCKAWRPIVLCATGAMRWNGFAWPCDPASSWRHPSCGLTL